MLVMSKFWAILITVHDALKTIDGQGVAFLLCHPALPQAPANFHRKAVHDAATNLKYLKNT